jgi:diguanylate cyclase (GGDEF)-like protein
VLFQDRKKRLWIGTENGLDRLDPNGRFTRFSFSPAKPDSIGPGGMAAMIEDHRGRIWAGANGGPLEVIEEDATGATHFHRIGVAEGMPHENVDGLAEDSRGRIWASTDRGIALIDPNALRARALGLADGLTDGAFWAGSMTRGTDGTMFFGGLDGITVIAPDATSTWDYAPPVVVTALRVGHKNVPPWTVNRGNAPIDMPAGDRDLSVEFSALDYSAPQLLHYAYKLDGYDRDWIDADVQHRGATYTHLPAGDYTLEMRGTNRLGVWSSHVLLIPIHATPLWFETWWFRLLAVALVLLIAFAVYRWRTGVLRRRQRELEAVVAKRTSELSDANTKLQELSLSDPLTGLRNRRFLAQHLEADISLTLRRYDDWRAQSDAAEPPQDADILFFIVDLDHFKSVNDRYGHNGGDAVLAQMRDRLQEVFRDSDFIVRWGGDEFLAVARGSRRSEAPAIAQRMCEAVNGRPFAPGGDQMMNATASIGFAAFPFVQSDPAAISWSHVVGLADQALYKSKQAGRNTWFGVTASVATDPQLLNERLENDPDEAIADGRLETITHAD